MNTTTLAQAPDQYQVMLNNYANILEKTNQQLGLWTNPYGLMIGLLTIIMAIAAIVVSIILWKNSREQRQKSAEFYKKQEEKVAEEIKVIKEVSDREVERSAKREERAREYETKFNDLIDIYKDKLNTLDAGSEEEIARVEKIVDNLNKAKSSLSSYEIPTAKDASYADDILGTYGHTLSKPQLYPTICSNCQFEFKYKNKDDNIWGTASVNFFNNKKVKCPHCGHDNYIQS